MSIFKELKTKPSRKDLVSLALTFLVGFGALGALFHFRLGNPGTARSLWIVAVAGFVLALIPGIGRLLYIAWMGFGMAIGVVTSPIVLMILYAIVVVPVGFVFKLLRRDSMRRRVDRKAGSYWEDYPQSSGPETYLKRY